MHYHKEYRGQGKSLMNEVIVLQTLTSTSYELLMPGVITQGMEVPTITDLGSEGHNYEFFPGHW